MDIEQAIALHKTALMAILKGLTRDITDDQFSFTRSEKSHGGKTQVNICIQLNLSPLQRDELGARHFYETTTLGILNDYLTAAREHFNSSAVREYLWMIMKINGEAVTGDGHSPYWDWLRAAEQATDAVSQTRQGISLEEIDRYPPNIR